ncbi:DUF4041 domain-containing protein [Actinomycetospora straminea]|uniref:DUF4041 domain-containing protein n=1 Tax=Actinomycetospora straminea TaxID=663607 RepID=A0ABP9EEQ4_9PSEU|nr:DUF4041 domain-containing protein [Actinomycetospora straminea]MDD7935648.1 DUF4041 domain-containing protein [Actinomycetospora straminea]
MPVFGARKHARELASTLADVQQENDLLRDQLSRMGALDVVELRKEAARAEQEMALRRREIDGELAALRRSLASVAEELERARQGVVETRESALLQEVGVYQYQHPLDSAVAYKAEIGRIKDSIKAMNLKDGGAVSGATNWTVNGSLSQGRAMVRETSKLMLRAYNAEADNLVRSMKPYKLDSSRERLNKVVATVEKLGKTMNISITASYHRLRLMELELTADHLEKVAQEKEREREEKARLREERKAQEEIERERTRLEKERQHYENALAKVEASGDDEAVARLRLELAEIETAIEQVDYRAANIRAGYVYVISNIGSFGPDVVKIGMTRRLEPMDRVRELGDASVPFRFDVHVLQFSKDAVGIENRLHTHFAAQRVNQVNQRREFFYATPAEVRDQLLRLAGDLITFEETPEALEYRQSSHLTGRVTTPSAVSA